MSYTVNKLAKLSGISVRTLHYYDEVGLLKPSGIKENGYRYYEEKELLRLQQILFYRELEFSLDAIKNIIDNPKFNMMEALVDHKKLLESKKKRIETLLSTIDTTITNMKGGGSMGSDDLYQGFSDEEMKKLQEEAKAKWGYTDAYKQSIQRTKHWTKKDYDKAGKDQRDITKEMADLFKSGKSIDNEKVQNVIEKHYQYINQFYDAPIKMYRNLGHMYVDDPRFTAYYDNFAKGLAVFVRDAIGYYCDHHK